MSRPPFLPLALAAVLPLGAVVAAPASATVAHPHAEQAFRKGIRDVARLDAHGAKPSRIRISCVEVPKVDDTGACTGSFDLTRGGRTAHYVLTKRAATVRLSRHAIEYHVYSRAAEGVRGLPRETALLGFLQ
jgi:hypothetical protein